MKIVVDTNIIFSVLLNSNGSIGNILFNSNDIFQFYSCEYMRYEIDKHWNKLLKISKLKESELRESHYKVLSKLHFINEQIIPSITWKFSEEIVQDIDIDDADFIALTKHIKGYLWTGDKELYDGLKNKNFTKVYNTNEIVAKREKLQKK